MLERVWASSRLPVLLLLVMSCSVASGCAIQPISSGVVSRVAVDSPCGAKRDYDIIPTESRVAFFATEHWLKPEEVTDIVIGKTGLITGSITVNPLPPASVTVSPIEVNLYGLTTHDIDLDHSLRSSYLQSNVHPVATFTTQRLIGLPTICKAGEAFSFEIEGELTIRNVAKQVRFTIIAQLDGDRLTGKATTRLRMTMFGISPPSKIGISTVENEVEIECEFVAKAVESL